MRISKVYTRTGDKGETSLVSGDRVSKASLRVEAFGEVDELNSLLGVIRADLADTDLDATLATIQNDLFTVGADLASPASIEVPRIGDAFIENLESFADKYLQELTPLKEFILPGGCEKAALLHLARTVTRRTERRVVALAATDEINQLTIVYLNRLSDLLFILARVTNKRSGIPEPLADFSRRRK